MTTLTRLRSLLEQATPGPWHIKNYAHPGTGEDIVMGVFGRQQYADDGCGGTYDDSEQIIETDAGVYGPKRPDADLIVSAINALPALLRIAEAAQAVCAWDASEGPSPNDIRDLRAALASLDATEGES